MCYALKGNYTDTAIKAAQYVRLKAIEHNLWVDAMVAQVKRQNISDGMMQVTSRTWTILKRSMRFAG